MNPNPIDQVSESLTKSVEQAVGAAEQVARHTNRVVERRIAENRRVFRRHPFLFGFFGTFGLVLVVTGFQDFARTIPFLRDNPVWMLLAGVVLLFATGALYRRLQQG